MTGDLTPYLAMLNALYNMVGHIDYSQVSEAINGLPITDEMKTELHSRFPQPECAAPVAWEEDDGEEDYAEAYLKNPPDPGPLSEFSDHGWMDAADPDKYRNHPFYKEVQRRTGISDPQVLDDIRENTLHILGRCNNPEDWGENKQGLVYGMVQSGKTASMINLISMGLIAGYKLIIILAGDKNSLRKQTQKRIEQAFKLENGINPDSKIHSPTTKDDFSATGLRYTGSFRTNDLVRGRPQYSTIIVMKKETHHLNALIQQIQEVHKLCNRTDGLDMEANFPTLILDDEADYASIDRNPGGDPSKIHSDLVALRNSIPRNCYVAYTATPQACLSADTNDVIGYPNDFFWLLEPYVKEINGQEVTLSYLGAWDVFHQYDEYLVNTVGRNEWPHYEKDDQGKDLGIWYPGMVGEDGYYEEDMTNDESQKHFLEQVRNGERPIPPSLLDAIADFLIGASIRWWNHWNKTDATGILPGVEEVKSTYKHHAIMIHLSRLKEHQLIAREIVEKAWREVKDEWGSFDLDTSPEEHLFKRRWTNQKFRTSRLLPNRPHMPYSQLEHFVKLAIEIAEEPIRQDTSPYSKYPNSPYTYLINSGESGMRLYYDEDDPWQIKTKRAAIIIGGDILSRGLTIEGLSVSFFGRTAKMPMGDTVLQMGRWFGHKKPHIDLIQIYMQEGLRTLFRHIAEADRYLRIQIKDAIIRGLKPDEILIELRNSPQFRATSPTKSKFVNFSFKGGYSGRRALLREPIMRANILKENNKRLMKFRQKYRSVGKDSHKRAQLYSKIPVHDVISLLNDLKSKNTAIQDTFRDYATFLKDWVEGDNLPPLPNINIAIMHKWPMRRRRESSVSKPSTAKEARDTVTGVFGAIVGGVAHGTYRGDYFLDKDEKWHAEHSQAKGSEPRKLGDDILIVFYGLDPNYVRNKLFDKNDTDEKHPLGKWKTEVVKLQETDRFYVEIPPGEEELHAAIVFAAFTPRGGPQYGLGRNSMLDPSKIKQIGLRNLMEEAGE